MTTTETTDELWTSFPCRDGFPMRALLYRPRGAAPAPALLFIAEPWGLNPEMRRVAGEMAAAGYVVLMPDLVSRGNWFACVRALVGDLRRGEGRGVDDLLDARAFLEARPEVETGRVAVMGLCMGGGFALLLARTGLFRVSAPFYGQVPADLTGSCPVVASFGGRDRMLADDAQHLTDEARRLGLAHDVKTYPEAGHSFMTRPPNPLVGALIGMAPVHGGYDPQAAADATRRVLAFLAEHV